MKCRDCIHWDNYTPDLGRKESVPGEWGDCRLAHTRDGKPDAPDTLAYAWDTIPCLAGLRCHESFGCVQFAAE